MQRTCHKLVAGTILMVVASGCPSGPEAASPQTGPLVGSWQYTGKDRTEEGYVRALVIGDQTWWIPQLVTFRADGTTGNGRVGPCHYWILDAAQLKLDCSAGQTIISYTIAGDKLTLDLRGPNAVVNDGRPVVE